MTIEYSIIDSKVKERCLCIICNKPYTVEENGQRRHKHCQGVQYKISKEYRIAADRRLRIKKKNTIVKYKRPIRKIQAIPQTGMLHDWRMPMSQFVRNSNAIIASWPKGKR